MEAETGVKIPMTSPAVEEAKEDLEEVSPF